MASKSETCVGKRTGRAVTEYWSESDALDGADHVLEKCGKRMAPYHCARCERWHLSPAERETPSFICHSCTGRNGHAKATYRTEAEARRRAEILREEQGAELTIYPCPSGTGWHLTKATGVRWSA